MRHLTVALSLSLLALTACGKQETVVADSASPSIRGQRENPATTPEQKPVTVVPKPEPKPVDPNSPPVDNPFALDFEAAVRDGHAAANEIRGLHALGELRLDAKLSAIAQAHAEDMKARNFFDHVNPDKEGLNERYKKARIQFRAAAENIAMGVPTAKEVFAGWMASPGHKTNLLNKAYSRHGLGYKDGIWVHVFAD